MNKKSRKPRGIPFGLRKTVMTLKLSLIFTFLIVINTYARVYSQKGVINLQIKDQKLGQVLTQIKDNSDVQILFNVNAVKDFRCKNLNLKNIKVKEALDIILDDSNFYYTEIDGVIVIREKIYNSQENNKKITGKVIDKNGEAVAGVTIIIKGTYRGTSTNANGEFSIEVPTNKQITLIFSSIGMEKLEVVVKDDKPLKVVMHEIVSEMEEAVITGIFNKPKESFTGAAVKITREQLKVAGNRNILQAISNIDPSFMVIENNIEGSNPNTLPSIQLRGTSTIPTMSDFQAKTRANISTPLFILDGFEISLERMMDLNNDEISSITILKDASSTALYGSRGSNGVVVITSIKPKKGRLKVSYRNGLNLEIPNLSSYNLMNAKDKLDLEFMAGLYNSNIPKKDFILKNMYADKFERVSAGVNTDWIRIPTRVGVGQNHYVGISGGDDIFRYSMGVSYNNIMGAMKGSERETFNGNISLQYIHKKFNFVNSISFGVNGGNQSPYGSFDKYVAMNPYWEPFDANGYPIVDFESKKNPLFIRPIGNPVYNAMQGSFNKSEYTNVTNNMSLNYRPIPELQTSIRVSFSKNFSSMDNFISPNATDFIRVENLTGRGSRTQSTNKSISWATGATVNYYKTFGDHIISAGANVELRESSNEFMNISVYGFVNNNMNGMSNANSFLGERPTSGDNKSRHIGIVSSINYSYKSRYYADLAYRLDGASSFGSESRFAPFWSVGIGWTISNEQFMKEHLPWISSMRIKWSYGVTGSMSFSPWQSLGTYKYLSGSYINNQYQGMIGAVIRGLENKDLKWQDTFQHNIGFEFSILENRLAIGINYYHKLTNNAITDMSIPLSNGFEKYTGNSGEILNTGIDINASLTLIRDEENQIYWTTTFGTAYNKNKLLKLSQAVKDRMNELRENQSSGLYYVFQEGNSVDAIYAVRTLGVDPSSGQLVYLYRNGTQSLDYNVNERVVVGDRMPKLDARIGTSFTYKGLSINMNFTVRSGAQQYNNTFANKVENVDLTRNVDNRVKLNRWIKPGDESSFIGLGMNNYYITDRYVQNEILFSCNNINISYNFNSKFLKKLKLERLSISTSLGNIFYLSTIKRERGTSYPYAIQPTFGLSCAF